MHELVEAGMALFVFGLAAVAWAYALFVLGLVIAVVRD